MKKYLLLAFLILPLASNLFSQDKAQFDYNLPDLKSNLMKMGTEYLLLSNEGIEITLLKNGYFTIGTNLGNSPGSLDDSCQVTYGHPYAMTSYPYFKVNGVKKYPDVYFYGQTSDLVKKPDSLEYRTTEDSAVGLIFTLSFLGNGNTVRGELKLINKSTAPADLTGGIVFDPALGKWGDGFVFNNNILVQSPGTFTTVPQTFDIRERSTSPKGLGISISFPDILPDRVEIANWFDIYNDSPSSVKQLFDAALNMEKDNSSIAPGDTLTLTFDIILKQPEFPDGLFLRSQIPSFLSIENNLLFPGKDIALTEVYNNSQMNYRDLQLNLQGGEYIKDYEAVGTFNMGPGDKVFKKLTIASHEIYESLVTPLRVFITSSSQVQDELVRNLFIPASPFSDTGLVVDIDSVDVNFPKLTFRFKSFTENNGSLLANLQKENLFLYEDDQRITDFTLSKDTSSGTNQADIVFILDVTGSMSEEIEGVKVNMVEFTDSLSRKGIDFRLGMVTFLDIIENIYDFTSDIQLFQQRINDQYAHGGDDTPENSLEALMRGAQFDFRPSAKRIFIWITDADYHIANSITQYQIQDIVNEMLTKAITVHCIGDVNWYQTDFYDPIVLPTGGNNYNIYGNFRDILLDISRLKESGKYMVNYTSTGTTGLHQVKLVIHYAGLGGEDIFSYTSGSGMVEIGTEESVVCYPNPFNPVTTIFLQNPNRHRGEVIIYNALGQKVRTFSFGTGQNPVMLEWNAVNEYDSSVGSGIYFVQVQYFDDGRNTKYLPVQKLIYLK